MVGLGPASSFGNFISTYTQPSGITSYKKEENITIYPNPATNVFSITSTDKIKEVILYNVLGCEILSFDKLRMTTNETIDISTVSKGIYFAEIKTEIGIVRKKIIKE